MAFPLVMLPAPVFNVPDTFTPVLVTSRTLAVPATETPTLPFTALMFTFDVPLAILGPVTAITPVKPAPLPVK